MLLIRVCFEWIIVLSCVVGRCEMTFSIYVWSCRRIRKHWRQLSPCYRRYRRRCEHWASPCTSSSNSGWRFRWRARRTTTKMAAVEAGSEVDGRMEIGRVGCLIVRRRLKSDWWLCVVNSSIAIGRLSLSWHFWSFLIGWRRKWIDFDFCLAPT